MSGVYALVKVSLMVICFAALTSAAKRERRSTTNKMPNECLLKADDGPCRAMIKRFFFNIHTQQCEEFVYGGCEGNQNRFESLKECKDRCIHRRSRRDLGGSRRRRRRDPRRESRLPSRS